MAKNLVHTVPATILYVLTIFRVTICVQNPVAKMASSLIKRLSVYSQTFKLTGKNSNFLAITKIEQDICQFQSNFKMAPEPLQNYILEFKNLKLVRTKIKLQFLALFCSHYFMRFTKTHNGSLASFFLLLQVARRHVGSRILKTI